MKTKDKRIMRADPMQVDALCDCLTSMRRHADAFRSAAAEARNRAELPSAQPDAAPIWHKLERGYLDAATALALCANDAQAAMMPGEQHSGTILEAPDARGDG